MKLVNEMFERGVYAGTFGPLHIGHKTVINKAMEMVKFLTIGVMSKKLVQDKVKGTEQVMPSYKERCDMVKAYMYDIGYKGAFEIVCVRNPIEDGLLYNGDALIISGESAVITRATVLNSHRRCNGMPELIIIVIPRVRYTNGNIISSTGIREGREDGE
jgi:pantetheine-phosphate adenylyltransferase